MLDAEIKFATCKIECGKETGTGFLVVPDKVLTARHCVLNAIDENTPITLSFKFTECSEKIKATIIDDDEDLDICLLLLEKTSEFTQIPLSETLPIGGGRFYAYGWPIEKLTIGHRLEGIISQVLEGPKLGMDVEIQIDTPTALSNYEGLSGSALISDGFCLGIIRVSVGNTIGVISIARIGEFLLKHEIVSEYIFAEKRDLEPIASQGEFIQKFDTFVTANSGGYIFIEGAHGIGKSTFCTRYTPLDPSLEHFDTYSFTSKRNTVNAVQLAQPQEFVNWLNMQVSMFITRQPGRIVKNDYPALIKETEMLLTRLGQEYISREKIGVLFIDGIDEVAKHDEDLLNRFIGLLPQQMPTGLALVISAPSYAIFSTRLGARLKPDICLSMPLLSSNVTQDFCRRALLENRSNPSTIKLISDKAQGHPLYLRYLIDLVNSGTNDNELATLPLIDGSIRNYYDALWDQLQRDAEAVNLLAIVVRLRWGISIQQFTEILNQAEQAVLVTTINRIKHLLLTPNETTIYHSSFSEFLVEKTQLRNPDIQRRLAEYCENHGDNHYGLLNVIYHGLKSESIANDHIVSLCDQKWVDNCVTEGVEPDVLLGDVHEVLKATTQRGNLVETVRILLLFQRIQFRYNILFAQSATLIANALISLGKTKEALKHVIRYDRLIISIPEALKIALELIDANSYQDALELLSLIETLINEELALAKNSNAISFSKFLKLYDLQLQQFVLKELADDQSAYLELMKFNVFWMENVDASSPNKEASKLIRSEMMTYMQAVMMCLSGRYITVSQLRQHYSGLANELIEPLIYTASYYLDLCNCFSVPKNKKLLCQVFDDLETLISDAWDDSKLIYPGTIDSLISLDAPSNVINVISDGPAKTVHPIQFIAENNVSMDESLWREGIVKWRFESFIDPDLSCPTLIVLSPSGWRDGIDSICRIIAWCDGSAKRIKQSSDITGLEILWLKLQQDVFEQLKFTLAQRVEWEDSYAIPEAVFPFIYQHLTNLIIDIFPEHLDDLLSFIEDRFSFQYGLYSEGFRLTLTNILNQLTRISLNTDIEDKAFLLTERWRDFVLKNLKNRHELVPELLTIIPLFVRLSALEEAQRTYQSVLAFSMGPSWYKEDQFSLMSTALKSINTDSSIGSSALSQIAALLDEASGEMTFQRFVRYAKRDFIGALCERGDFVNAVNFFIQQTYGTSEQLYKETSQGNIDRVSELRGCRYPGGALDEQDSIWHIVKSEIPIADWSLCWTLLEIFQFGDSRHLDRYAEAYALLIQKAQEDSNMTAVMMQRLKLICESEVEKTYSSEFMSSIKRHLPSELTEQFESLFEKFSNSENLSETKSVQLLLDPIDDNNKKQVEEQTPHDVLFLPGTFGKRDAIHEAKTAFSNAERHLRRRNKSEALKEILSGLKSIQNGGWTIWTSQIKEVSQGLRLLLQITTSPSEIINICSPIITSERYADIWLIANSLIEEFSSYANHDEQSALVKLAIEHTEIMVGVSDEHIQNHIFLENAQDIDASSSLIKLIVHAIDHPSWLRSEKAADMLLWLLRNHPQYIPTFAPKAFSMDSNNHPDVLCGVFELLSRSDSKCLWDQLAPALDFEKIKKDCKHVGRLSVLMRLASRAAKRGSDSASKALILLQENIFDPMTAANVFQETMIECPSWAKCIDFQWSKLKKQGLLSPELLERAIAVMNELSSPFSLETNLELEQLLFEGVGGNSNHVGRWRAKVSFAFQVALLPITTKFLFPQIEAIFRSYNPTRLDQWRITNFKSPAISWLAQLKKTHETIKPINGKDIYLDFYERIWFEGSWKIIRFTAYFYENETTLPLPSGRFLSTEDQTSANTSPWDTCINVKGFPAYFGSFTPAVPTSNLMQATRAKHSNLTRAYWRSGRVAESSGGGPEHEGCYLAIDKNALQLSRGIKLGWVFELDGKAIAMVTFD